jgi:hypothetical protein
MPDVHPTPGDAIGGLIDLIVAEIVDRSIDLSSLCR